MHFAFALEDAELEALQERIVAAGVEIEGPIQLGSGRAIYVTDPDGNVGEFWSQDMTEYCRSAREEKARELPRD